MSKFTKSGVAPLVVDNHLELGDKRLDEKEALAKIKEDNIALRAKDKIPGQAQLQDVQAALGTPMSYKELILRLKKMVPALVIQDGGVQNAVAVRIFRDNGDGEGPRLTYLTGFYKTILPEYSTVTVDEHGVALHENRGWRTVLLALMKQNVVSYRNVVKAFGNAMGQRSNRWHEQLQNKEKK
jgi:hypothetical protein